MTAPRCFFFGCWNTVGHFMHAAGGRRMYDHGPEAYRSGVHLDGTLAPRRMARDRRSHPDYLPPGSLCWQGQGKTHEERMSIEYASSEYPQGQFLRHVLDTGFTALQWWDRNQGDKRGACNSTILLEGERTTDELLAALREHFPHVVANLERAGVMLVEVPLS